MTAVAFDRRLTPARPDLAAEHLRGTVDAPRYAAPTALAVIAPLADMHPAPGVDGPPDTQLVLGERVAAYEIGEAWVWAQAAADGYVGYLARSALGQPGPEPTHAVAASHAHVYAEPAVRRSPVARLPWPARVTMADTVPATGASRPWARLAGGGFVPLGQLAPLDGTAPDWVAVAEARLGTPYRWGGSSGDGIDCSALIQRALAAAGIAFPRDSDQQRDHGPLLAPDTPPRRGDLVFWPGHLGVMLDATRLLHANAFHMAVAAEPLVEAAARIAAVEGSAILGLRRLG
ncbi:MAG: C40 family peptidase [Pseudomonadota bacterium]